MGRSECDAGSMNTVDGNSPTQSKSSRPLLMRSCLSLPVRRRDETLQTARARPSRTRATRTGSRRPTPVRCRCGATPKARARPPRTQAWTTLSGAAPAGAALSGEFSVTAQLSGRVATCQPRTYLIPGASPRGYSVSGIPGSYRSHGIHEPSSRLCCPGGSFVRSQSAGCVFVPRPNTARPEGGA